MIELVDRALCTACGECMYICPTKSIKFILDKYGNYYPSIAHETCINCGRCKIHCHVEKNLFNENKPYKAYVGWNTDSGIRRLSASGGIAAAIYKYALKKGYKVFGVSYSNSKGATYKEIFSESDIFLVQNSKYVYSKIIDIYNIALTYLKNGEKVIIPALPCQAASLKLLCDKYSSNLILIDIVCRGVCSQEFLNQHIAFIEKKQGEKADTIYFRDSVEGTDNYIFSLYIKGKKIYSAKASGNDVYQLGYHKSLTYRDNCYSCKYAQQTRVGDLTISDFTGLGREKPYTGPRESVSCILVSSVKGKQLLTELIDNDLIICEERPLEEAFLHEKQFKHPSIPHKKRNKFMDEYIKSSNFEKAARKALTKELFMYYSGLKLMKKNIKNLLNKKTF